MRSSLADSAHKAEAIISSQSVDFISDSAVTSWCLPSRQACGVGCEPIG